MYMLAHVVSAEEIAEGITIDFVSDSSTDVVNM
jgi:hypothetical protein